MISVALVLLQAIIYQTATIQRFQTKGKKKREEKRATQTSLSCVKSSDLLASQEALVLIEDPANM